MATHEVIALYRTLIRTCRKSFQGDATTISAALVRVREEFQEARGETDPKAIQEKVQIGKDTIEFLKDHIVQGVLNERGNYEVKLEEQHGNMVLSQEEDGQCSSKDK